MFPLGVCIAALQGVSACAWSVLFSVHIVRLQLINISLLREFALYNSRQHIYKARERMFLSKRPSVHTGSVHPLAAGILPQCSSVLY